MVQAPKHKDEQQGEQAESKRSSSHPTKDSEHRDKASKSLESFGNEWDASAAGGE